MEWIASPEAWIALLTLTLLEIVLGIDNIVFISILSGRLPEEERPKAMRVGLGVAMASRILLLLAIAWIMRLTAPLFSLLGHEFSGKDLILIAGGLFLLAKATTEIHHKLEGPEGSVEEKGARRWGTTFGGVIVQILLLDLVFSVDSVITAVGMADDVAVMITAIVVAVGVMMAAATPVSAFVNEHPTVKMLALSFLLLIGMALVAEGVDQHIPKGYLYFAMGFSLFVEMLNLRVRRPAREPIHLRAPYRTPAGASGAPEAGGGITGRGASGSVGGVSGRRASGGGASSGGASGAPGGGASAPSGRATGAAREGGGAHPDPGGGPRRQGEEKREGEGEREGSGGEKPAP